MYKKYVGIIMFLIVCLVFSTFMIIKPFSDDPPTVKAAPVISYVIC
jgi:hypothetical protein